MKTIAIFVLAAAISLAASDSKSTAISVRVVPEVLISVNGTESVGVKIRLSEIGKAQVWIGDNCSSPLADSTTIEHSGVYQIPLATLPGSGRMVCLASQVDGLMQGVALLVPRGAAAPQLTGSTLSLI